MSLLTYFGRIAFVVSLMISIVCSQRAAPGSRNGAMAWTDKNGDLWLFGGGGFDNSTAGYLNDLWKFEQATSRWIWVGGSSTIYQPGVYGTRGIPSSLNIPGARANSVTWTDSRGIFWLFGGRGNDAQGDFGNLNDIWKYNTSANEWTWVSGSDRRDQPAVYGTKGTPSNTTDPGGRVFSIGWIDSNDSLWIFGGADQNNVNRRNDLWKYNVSSNQWTWVSGSNGVNQPATLTPADAAVPASRVFSVSWIDSHDTLWLFGGTTTTVLNDLWKYNITANQWTLVKGNPTTNQGGSYGTRLVPADNTFPGSRAFAVSWTDSRDNLWLWGGISQKSFNDLWRYNSSANQWTWMSGSSGTNQIGVYTTKGVPSSTAVPGARLSAVSWIDPNNNLWLFGGTYDTGLFRFNDLWKYNMTTDQWTWMAGSSQTEERGVYVDETSPMAVSIPVSTDAPKADATPTSEVTPQSQSQSHSPEPTPDVVSIVVPSVVIPVAGVAIFLGVLLGLRQRRAKQKQLLTSPIPLLGQSDRRLIPFSAVILEKEIGAGSYGKVYVGKWQATKVAVKVGNAAISTEEFLKEAELQMSIPPHPNIVQLLGVSTDGPRPLVVLEYCNEGSLDQLLFDVDEKIPAQRQLLIVHSIAKGLNHLHQNNVVHRDLAARNVLMHNGEAKISDFGLSRALKTESQVGKTSSTLGPIRWMAPESIANHTYSTKSDVWMFGIILYEITARQEPHIGEDQLNIAIKIRDSGVTPVMQEDCLLVLKEIMEMCWQIDPNMRPTMAQICEKLETQIEQ